MQNTVIIIKLNENKIISLHLKYGNSLSENSLGVNTSNGAQFKYHFKKYNTSYAVSAIT